MSPNTSAIHIGTSGWSYPHWRGSFYPSELPSSEWFGYYRQHFDSVELNATFYRLPSPETVTQWRDRMTGSFVCSVKGSRYLTHLKKLKDPKQGLSRFLERIKLLDPFLGPLLFQLPPRWRCNVERLEAFLAAMSPEYACAFEFRDQSWFCDEVYAVLRAHGAAFCMYDFDRRQSPRLVTADVVYIRLHGPDGAYCGSYSRQTLQEWAEAIRQWVRDGRQVYCYFDNDEAGYAARDALALQDLLNV